MICDTRCESGRKKVNSTYGIQVVYMYLDDSGILGGETRLSTARDTHHFTASVGITVVMVSSCISCFFIPQEQDIISKSI